MKNPDRETVSRLEALPNIGKTIGNKLQMIGIDNPRDLIGKEPFELYDRDRQIFRETAKVAINTNRKVNAELNSKLPKSDISINEYYKKNGVEVIDLAPEEREAFQKAIVPVWNRYRKKIGNDIYNFTILPGSWN